MHLEWENRVRMLLHLEGLAFASVINGVSDGLMLEVISGLMDIQAVLLVAVLSGLMNMEMDVSVVRLQLHGSHKG